MMLDSEQQRLMQLISADVSRQTFGAQIVSGLLLRGDRALRLGRWQNAANCYLGAYFCDGGQNETLRARIELARRLGALEDEIAAATEVVEADELDRVVLRRLANRLAVAADMLDWIRNRLPHSHPIAAQQQRLKAIQIRVAGRLHGDAHPA